jgi:hypothetical protein
MPYSAILDKQKILSTKLYNRSIKKYRLSPNQPHSGR